MKLCQNVDIVTVLCIISETHTVSKGCYKYVLFSMKLSLHAFPLLSEYGQSFNVK